MSEKEKIPVVGYSAEYPNGIRFNTEDGKLPKGYKDAPDPKAHPNQTQKRPVSSDVADADALVAPVEAG